MVGRRLSRGCVEYVEGDIAYIYFRDQNDPNAVEETAAINVAHFKSKVIPGSEFYWEIIGRRSRFGVRGRPEWHMIRADWNLDTHELIKVV